MKCIRNLIFVKGYGVFEADSFSTNIGLLGYHACTASHVALQCLGLIKLMCNLASDVYTEEMRGYDFPSPFNQILMHPDAP
jgi:hypothetical protein